MENRTQMPKPVWFAAANTANGFYSCFDTLFSPDSGEWEKIYIIKGGPGTGKSSFMRRVGEEAARRGYAVEAYACSSDPASLDGLRIPALGIALLDGTAPHAVDPQHPGAVEEILNMGMFFRAEQLKESLPAIRAAQEENAASHRLASRYLHAAGTLRQAQRTLAERAYLKEKASAAAARMLRGMHAQGEHTPEIRFETAISTQGMVHLTTAEQMATERIYIADGKGLACFFLDTLYEEACRRGIPVTRYAAPLLPAETEGVYLPAAGRLYYTDRFGRQQTEDRVINTARFFDKDRLRECRERYHFAAKCLDALTDGALQALADAGRAHDALESHYIAAMDFKAQTAFTTRFLRSLFGTGKKT